MDPLPKYLVLDGGFSTELVYAHGQSETNNDPLWGSRLLATNPDIIKKVHISFLEAGSDVISTATYQGSVSGFQKYLNLSKVEAELLLRKGTEVAVAARDDFWQKHPELHTERRKPMVAASIGPYGAHLCDGSEYNGHYVDTISTKELSDWHQTQLEVLLHSGADIIAIETIPAKKEAQIVGELLSQHADAKAWVSFTCKDNLNTCHGETFSDSVASLLDVDQVVAVGINCSRPDQMASLLSTLSPEVKRNKRIVVYPNSGEDWSKVDKTFCGQAVGIEEDMVAQWLQLGAQWIGGCCRMTPIDIRNIRRWMQKYAQPVE